MLVVAVDFLPVGPEDKAPDAVVLLSTSECVVMEFDSASAPTVHRPEPSSPLLLLRFPPPRTLPEAAVPTVSLRMRSPQFRYMIDTALRRTRLVVWSGLGRFPVEYGTPLREPHRFGDLVLLQPDLPPPDWRGQVRCRCACGRPMKAEWHLLDMGALTCCRECSRTSRGGTHVRFWRTVVHAGCAPIWHDYEVYRRDVPMGWRPVPLDPTQPVGPANCRLVEYVGRVSKRGKGLRDDGSTADPTTKQLARILGLWYASLASQVKIAGGRREWLALHPEHAEAVARWQADPEGFVYPPEGCNDTMPTRSWREKKVSAEPRNPTTRGTREKAIRRCLASGMTVGETIAATGASRAAVALVRQWLIDEKAIGLEMPTDSSAAEPTDDPDDDTPDDPMPADPNDDEFDTDEPFTGDA